MAQKTKLFEKRILEFNFGWHLFPDLGSTFSQKRSKSLYPHVQHFPRCYFLSSVWVFSLKLLNDRFMYLKERLFSVSGRPTAEFFLREASAVTTGLRRNRSATGEGLRAFEKAVEFTRWGP
jgi:hypothetical protein